MHTEKTMKVASGLFFLPFLLLLLGGAVWLLVHAIANKSVWMLVTSLVGMVVDFFLLAGLFVVNPNEAALARVFSAWTGWKSSNPFR